MANLSKILHIDDQVGFTKLLKINLESTGKYVVEIVNNSEESVEAAHRFKPNLTLLDIVMPNYDGGDIIALFEADPILRVVPVIILSAMISGEEIEMRPPLVYAGIGIPVNHNRLLEVIDRVLDEAQDNHCQNCGSDYSGLSCPQCDWDWIKPEHPASLVFESLTTRVLQENPDLVTGDPQGIVFADLTARESVMIRNGHRMKVNGIDWLVLGGPPGYDKTRLRWEVL